MTKETRTVEQTIFKAEDGTIFFDELECAMYEQKNPYNEIIKEYHHLNHIMFFDHEIEGFWCESQEQVDNCCNWFTTNYKNIGKRVSAGGKFFEDDYYFFIPYNTPIDDDETGIYLMCSFKGLCNQWEFFLMQLPPELPQQFENINNVESEDITKEDTDKLRIAWFNEFFSSPQIYTAFEEFVHNKIQELEKSTEQKEKNA